MSDHDDKSPEISPKKRKINDAVSPEAEARREQISDPASTILRLQAMLNKTMMSMTHIQAHMKLMQKQMERMEKKLSCVDSLCDSTFSKHVKESSRNLVHHMPKKASRKLPSASKAAGTMENSEISTAIVNRPATLCSHPRSLEKLWQEYILGIDGRKPAEKFTKLERNNLEGGFKTKYYRRNKIWKCIKKLVDGGDTPETAIGKIREVYGDIPFSLIVNKIVMDGKNGGHLEQRLMGLKTVYPLTKNEAESQGTALLSKNPLSLETLWEEYKFGIDGNKPAEKFTTEEKNQKLTKQKYYRRRVVWQCIEKLMEGGDTESAAIAKINQVYGPNQSVTRIINLMIEDRKNGGHPALR